MIKLKKGELSPSFFATNYLGEEVKLENFKGKKVLLSFHVFGSCPFCNLRVRELGKKNDEWRTNGLEMIHVFPSTGETISKYAGNDNPSFTILSDPHKQLYKMYGLKKSVLGMLMGFFKVKRLFQAFRVVGLFNSLKNNDSAMHQLPADFLIDENGIIQEAFYAKTTSDNLPISKIENFIYQKKKAA